MTATTKEMINFQFLDPFGTELQILAYVGVAMLLGAIIGLEREFKDKPAACVHTCSSQARLHCSCRSAMW